jgi:hypothetical protein
VQIFEHLEQDQLSAEDLQFNTFQSCEQMNDVLTDYIKDNFSDQWNGNFRRGIPMPMVMNLAVEEMAFADEADTTTATE